MIQIVTTVICALDWQMHSSRSSMHFDCIVDINGSPVQALHIKYKQAVVMLQLESYNRHFWSLLFLFW